MMTVADGMADAPLKKGYHQEDSETGLVGQSKLPVVGNEHLKT